MQVLQDILKNAGLETTESLVYTTLLNNGALTVLEISNISKLKRTNLYNILEDLEKKNLVKKVETQSTTKYFPESPREIQKLLELKEDQINSSKNTFELLIDSLQSKHNLISHKPTITYFEGLTGLQKIYQDILDTGKDILLIRSTFDDKRKDVDKLIQKQITEQVKRGIHAKVVGPPEKDAKELYLEIDKIRLVEEHFITKFPFEVPAQLIIYGNKTAIATIRKDIIITLIDNNEITQTFKVMFEFIWNYATVEHEDLVRNWT
jgi:sugar-specific transcriptional regulator TrmB